MLGHLHPSTCSLDESVKVNYKNLYCSICASIREKNHLGYTFLINNELTLVLLSLRNYYQVNEGTTPCPSSLFTQKNPISTHPIISKAGDLSVLLGWIKSEDWKADKGNFVSRFVANTFVKKAHPLLEKTSNPFQKTIQDYIELTKNDNKDFAFVKKQSALLSKALVLELSLDSYIPEAHLKCLLELFHHAGILINLTDHLLDLDKDIEKKQYNPISENTQSTEEIVKNYHQLKQDFQFHIQESFRILTFIEKYEISNSTFYTAFSESINRMKKEVQHKKPQLIQFFEKENSTTDYSNLTIIKNDCGPDGCNPDTTSFIAGNCNDCCSACCKPGGGGGSCCCNDCKPGHSGGSCCCKPGSGGNCCCNDCKGCNCNSCCSSCCDKCYDNICNSCQESCFCCDCCCTDVNKTTPVDTKHIFTKEQIDLFEKIMSEQLHDLENKEDSLQKLLNENPKLDSLTTELEKINTQKESIQKQLDSYKQ